MKVIVLGATGRLGRELVRQLVDAGTDVTALVRRPEQLGVVASMGASGALGDVEDGDLTPVLRGADALVWSVGASHVDPPGHPERIRDGGVRATAAARRAEVGRWIQVSSMFADRPEHAPPPLRPSMKLKGDVDTAVRASQVPWTIVRPGGLGDGPGMRRVSVGSALDPGMIDRADVAAVVVELIRTGLGIGAAFDLVAGATPVTEAVASLAR